MLIKAGTFILTTEDVDSYGDIVLSKGIDLSRFKSNSVLLYNHMRGSGGLLGGGETNFPIGEWRNIVKRNGQVKAEAWINSNDKTGAKVLELVDLGILKSASIGIQVIERDSNDTSIITKSSIMEASIVDIPANPNATLVSKSYGAKFETKGTEQSEYTIKSAVSFEKNPPPTFTPSPEDILIKSEVSEKTTKMKFDLINFVKSFFGYEAKDQKDAAEYAGKQAPLAEQIATATEKASKEIETLKGQVTELKDQLKESAKKSADELEAVKADYATSTKFLSDQIDAVKAAFEVKTDATDVNAETANTKAGIATEQVSELTKSLTALVAKQNETEAKHKESLAKKEAEIKAIKEQSEADMKALKAEMNKIKAAPFATHESNDPAPEISEENKGGELSGISTWSALNAKLSK